MAVEILQFSDTHLFESAGGTLVGQNTFDSLSAVLDLAQRHDWPPDFILVTGDISQDRTEKSYRLFRERMEKLAVPIYILPGNHDDSAAMEAIFRAPPVEMKRVLERNGWRLLCLNSAVPGQNGGKLAESELSFLSAQLEKAADTHVLVCMHHSPVAVGSAWLDAMALENSDPFFSLLDRFPQVKSVAWGHVHQGYEGARKSIKLMGGPSTCVQFKPETAVLEFDAVGPGYRKIKLFPDGRIETAIVRVGNFQYTIDKNARGYR